MSSIVQRRRKRRKQQGAAPSSSLPHPRLESSLTAVPYHLPRPDYSNVLRAYSEMSVGSAARAMWAFLRGEQDGAGGIPARREGERGDEDAVFEERQRGPEGGGRVPHRRIDPFLLRQLWATRRDVVNLVVRRCLMQSLPVEGDCSDEDDARGEDGARLPPPLASRLAPSVPNGYLDADLLDFCVQCCLAEGEAYAPSRVLAMRILSGLSVFTSPCFGPLLPHLVGVVRRGGARSGRRGAAESPSAAEAEATRDLLLALWPSLFVAGFSSLCPDERGRLLDAMEEHDRDLLVDCLFRFCPDAHTLQRALHAVVLRDDGSGGDAGPERMRRLTRVCAALPLHVLCSVAYMSRYVMQLVVRSEGDPSFVAVVRSLVRRLADLYPFYLRISCSPSMRRAVDLMYDEWAVLCSRAYTLSGLLEVEDRYLRMFDVEPYWSTLRDRLEKLGECVVDVEEADGSGTLLSRRFDVEEMVCPITRELPLRPTLCSDGFVYEEEAILRWIGRGERSPMTRRTLLWYTRSRERLSLVDEALKRASWMREAEEALFA